MKNNLKAGLVGLVIGASISAGLNGCAPAIGLNGKVYTPRELTEKIGREYYQKREVDVDEFGNKPSSREGIDASYLRRLAKLDERNAHDFIMDGNRAVLFYGEDNDSSFELMHFSYAAGTIDNANFGIVKDDNKELLSKYGIRVVPTILLFKDGQVIRVIDDAGKQVWFMPRDTDRAEKVKRAIESQYAK